MSTKIILAFTLVILAGFSSAQAESECLLEGHYSVDLVPYGSRDPFWLEGNVGAERIRWDVTRWFSDGTYKVRGWVKNTPIDLEMDLRWQPYTVRGWISRTYINWSGYNGQFWGYQSCVK